MGCLLWLLLCVRREIWAALYYGSLESGHASHKFEDSCGFAFFETFSFSIYFFAGS
jgi:hypothetical protein